MIEEITEVKEVTETKETVVGEIVKCDACGKIIYDTREDHSGPFGGRVGQHWWDLTTGHDDWGNDSVDSIEHFELCSPECLKVKFDEYCKESNRSNREFNSMYFKAEHASR